MAKDTPTLQELQEAAKFLPDPSSIETKEVKDYFGDVHLIDDPQTVTIEVNGKRIKFNLTSESGKGSRKYWFYYGAVEV
ncbi:hypothetical protein [Fischerella sp. PCC 9605]|uniref:hypothetical protein n=1 Tax=Fischerella sp. PCC 9605 TaxID=1173024 RepID=UPI000478AC51|nr:hypothetical protein [Fischerella sp. PCC 9605]